MPRLRVAGAQPPLQFIPPAHRPWVRGLIRLLLPLLLRRQGVVAIEARGAGALAAHFHEHQSGRIRLFLAFRHPSTRDPLLLAWLFWRELPRAARRCRVPLEQPAHAQFLYDRGIPLWAGALVGWVLASMGGIPIQRGKLDRPALRTARELSVTGPFPLAIAPEGATNNHGELISPLEPGLAQLAFWACDDLAAAQRPERVLIVPIGLRYPLLRPCWERIDHLLSGLEERLGLGSTAGPAAGSRPDPGFDPGQDAQRRYDRLLTVAAALLAELERFYQRAYGLEFRDDATFPERIARLQHRVLAMVEEWFALRSQGTLQERCRRIEQAGWERIYREDLADLPPVARGLADWTASEASLALEHMRLVEPFAVITGRYVAEKPTPDRYGELLLILWRAMAWIEGSQGRPPSLGPTRGLLQVGEPIDVTALHASYRKDRRRAVEQLTTSLRAALEANLPAQAEAARVGLPSSSA